MLVEAPRIRLVGPDLSVYRSRKRLVYRLCLYIVVLLLMSMSGCAFMANNARETGVRSGFEKTLIKKIAIMPFGSTDLFSLSEEEHRAMVQVYETSATLRLEAMGFEVMSSDQVSKRLGALGKLEELSRFQVDRPLTGLFEARRAEDKDDRLALLKELNAYLDTEAFFIAQVVYHTTARCEPTATSPYTSHVIMEAEPSNMKERVPCALSHFEAKLIEPTTTETVWYNRILREVRAGAVDAPNPDDISNARATVDLVLTERNKGLGGFLPFGRSSQH